MDTADPFVTVAGRSNPDDTLIPDTASPYTAVDYKGHIAESLGFPARRYSDALSRPVMNRLYIVVCRSLPEPTHTLDELKSEVARELDLTDSERFLDKPGRSYTRSELVTIFKHLQTITVADLNELLDSLDICPVCDSPVETREQLGSAGRMGPIDDAVCVHLDDGEITVVEHMDV